MSSSCVLGTDMARLMTILGFLCIYTLLYVHLYIWENILSNTEFSWQRKNKKNRKWSPETVDKNRTCNAAGPSGLLRNNPLLSWWVGLSVVTIMLLEMKTKLCSPVFNWQCHNACRDEMQVLWHNSSPDSCGSIIYLHNTPMTASILFLLWVKYDVLAMFGGFTNYGCVHIVCNQVHA